MGYPGQEILDVLQFEFFINFRETEIIKTGEVVSANTESGGIKAVQAADSAAHGAALHPQEFLLGDAGAGQLLRFFQNGRVDRFRFVAVTKGGEHGHALHGFEAAAEGAVNQTFFI